MMPNKNIYIIGYPMDLYRTQIFISVVLSQYKVWNLSICNFKVTNLKSNILFFKFFIRVLKLLNVCIQFIYKIYMIIMADYIYVTAMAVLNPLYRIEFFIARFMRKKILFEYYISIYDSIVLDTKREPAYSKKAKKLLRLDYLSQLSYRTIYLNYREAVRYSNLSNLDLNKLNYKLIPLCISERRKAILPYFNLKENIFNIFWWGTYIPLHGLEKIIAAIEMLIYEDSNIHLYILGNSEERSIKYRDIIKSKKLSEFITIRNDINFANGTLEPLLVSKCDLALGSFGDSDKAKNVILNKTIEAISMKIPVLTQHSLAYDLYYKDRIDIYYSDSTPHSIKNNIIEIKNAKKEVVGTVIENAYRIYNANFSPAAAFNCYNELLNDLMN